jgi:transposase InsO family protein/uncharacterized protein YqgQ
MNETLTEYLQALRVLSKDCNFQDVSAVRHRDEFIRDAFISGIQSSAIRQRLLEHRTLDLCTMFHQAQALESAAQSSVSFAAPSGYTAAVPDCPREFATEQFNSGTAAAIPSKALKCFFCGNAKHPRLRCPAREASCMKCHKRGHYARVCRGNATATPSASAAVVEEATLASIQPSNRPLSRSSAPVTVNGKNFEALFDSGSSESFIHPDVVKATGLQPFPASRTVAMAESSISTPIESACVIDLEYNGRKYDNLRVSVLPNLCSSLILGLDFQGKHKSVTFEFGGKEPSLIISSLSTLNVDPPSPFENLTADCHPIITKSRQYSRDDIEFIDKEVKRLLADGIIEPSHSPWRAQVVVTKDENHKKRLVMDYSQTINKFTLLDAFPLPRISDLINDIAQNRFFSTVDLRSAYHQIPLKMKDRPFTAFEASNQLFQFTRLPFGITNGVSCFQREMMKFVQEENLEGVYPYLDNITICGKNKEDHDVNLKRFLEAAKRKNITYNEEKSVFSTDSIPILGYVIGKGKIRPDPDRLKPLNQLPIPQDKKSLERCIGLFAYYSKWIPSFSDKVKPLVNSESFPLSETAVHAFNNLKDTIGAAVITAINDNLPFVVETDASDVAIAATLKQDNKPVAFFSRSLQGPELKHPAIEKEAKAIIEAVRHWRHFLTGRHFTLVTDQKSVSFMFNMQHKGRIKNDKILRWRLELACYDFDIVYRPGKENIPSDTFSRSTCASIETVSLHDLHDSLCHPGITRLYHFVRQKNLPFSLEEIKRMTNDCHICCECKPRFHKPPPANLIKATKPFERLNLDFKGPLPSINQNVYFLNVVDEFSRFPFVFPCADVSAKTVIKCLVSLFSIFGLPSYVHSDRGSAFMSRELLQFLTEKGVATSRTTSFNPSGNGQVERFNGTIWKAISMALKSKNLPVSSWQSVLPDVLHSVRSLLCTATNETPHERLFSFVRRSTTGTSLPSWLSHPGPVLMKRHIRNKTDDLVNEVELLHANSHYAQVRFPDGRETTVATKHLAPRGHQISSPSSLTVTDFTEQQEQPDVSERSVEEEELPSKEEQEQRTEATNMEVEAPTLLGRDTLGELDGALVLRRSSRVRKPVDRLNL